MKKEFLFLIFGLILLFGLMQNVVAAWNNELNDGMVDYHDYEGTGGGTLIDRVGAYSDYNGTIVDSPANVSSPIGSALNFSTNDYVNMNKNLTNGSSQGTICFLINSPSPGANFEWFFGGYTGGSNVYMGWAEPGAEGNNATFRDEAGLIINSNTTGVVGGWNLLCGDWGTLGRRFWQNNGSLVGYNVATTKPLTVGGYYIGNRKNQITHIKTIAISEDAAWTRQLNQSQIQQIYTNWMSGVGYSPGTASSISVVLTNPANGNILTTTGSFFNATATSSTESLVNMTYRIWFNNGTIFNQTTLGVSGATNQSGLFIDDFTLASYIWEVGACTASLCESSSNFTFIIGGNLTAQSYSAFSYETDLNSFAANISLLPGAVVYDQRLWFNGQGYTGTITNIGTDSYNLKRNIDLPLLNTSSINESFFWAITFQRPDGSFFTQNLTSAQQNVSQISFVNCSSGNIALNFTAWNEENRLELAPYDFFGTFNYWIGSGSVQKSFSLTNQNITQTLFCIDHPTLTYRSDAQLQYEKDSFVKRSHYFTNASITNTTNHIKLFLLNSTKSTSFIIDVLDQAQLAVPGVLINIQRYYPGNGTFQTTEMGLTDSQGSTIGHFEAETEDYKILIYRNNTLLFESGVQKIFCRDTPCTLTFQIGSVPIAQWHNFGNLSNVVWNLRYNETSKLWTFNYVDTSGTSQLGRLYVYIEGGAGRTSICNTNSSSTAASLTCNVSAYTGTIYAGAYLTYNGKESLVYLDSSILGAAAKNVFGFEGLFLSGLILLVLAAAGLWNPAVGIILVVVGMIILNFIGLATFGAITIWAVIFIALLLLWSLKT